MGNFRKISGFVFIIVSIYLFVGYWFFPFKATEFVSRPEHSNFVLNQSGAIEMQFYKNMRYPFSNISYKIYDCPLAKKNEMQRAFKLLENQTILNFYPVSKDEEISVTCKSQTKISEGMFIGGEGGPTNITKTNNFNVIQKGSILLIRETKCKNPNIASHELLHSLGFNHSSNENNVMYPVVKCHQTIGQDIIDLINEIYTYPPYPDLSFDDVSASIDGRFLDLNMTVRNHGLTKSKKAMIKIYVDDKELKEISLDALEVGAGRMLLLKNTFISKIKFDKIKLFIDYSYEEIDKQNNQFNLVFK